MRHQYIRVIVCFMLAGMIWSAGFGEIPANGIGAVLLPPVAVKTVDAPPAEADVTLAEPDVPLAEADDSPAVYRTTANLNLRTGPSTDSGIIMTVPVGSTVDVTYIWSDEWYAVEYNGAYGYKILNPDRNGPDFFTRVG